MVLRFCNAKCFKKLKNNIFITSPFCQDLHWSQIIIKPLVHISSLLTKSVHNNTVKFLNTILTKGLGPEHPAFPLQAAETQNPLSLLIHVQ